MPWWGWLLLGWSVVAVMGAVWIGLALANAATQEEGRQLTEDSPETDPGMTSPRQDAG